MQPDGIRFREYPFHPTLAPFVKCIWSMESDRPIYEAPRERILPDSCVELVVHFGDPFRSHFANGASDLQPRSFVAGQMKNFLEIEPAGRMGLIAVRFHARGAYLFLPAPLSAVAAALVRRIRRRTFGVNKISPSTPTEAKTPAGFLRRGLV